MAEEPTEERETAASFGRWRTRIAHARSFRQMWANQFDVEVLERFIIGQHYPSGNRRHIYNKFGASIRTFLPSLVIEDPRFLVRRKPGTAAAVNTLNPRLAEGVLDSIAQQDHHLADGARMGLQQAFVAMGVMKVVYDPTLVSNPRAGEPIFQRGPAGVPLVDDTLERIPAIDPIEGGPMVEPAHILRDEMYRWEYVDYRTMLLPDEGPDARKWSFVAEEITVSLEEAKQDERFPEEIRRTLQSNTSTRAGQPPRPHVGTSQVPQTDGRELFTYTEIYDHVDRTIKVIADGPGLNTFLMDEPLSQGIEQNPYAFLRFQKITGPIPMSWPYPLTRDWLPVQEDYNFVRRFEVQGAARGGRKGIYFDDTFASEEEADKFMNSANDMEYVKGLNPGNPPIFPSAPPVPSDAWRNNDALDRDWQTVTHQSAPRGQRGSATEALITERSADVNDADLAKAVKVWFAEMGRKMFQLVRQTLTIERHVAIRELTDNDLRAFLAQITGEDFSQAEIEPEQRKAMVRRLEQIQTFPVSRQQLEFEADVDIVPGSMKPRSLETEFTELLQVAELIGPLVFTVPSFNEALLARFEQLPADTAEEIAAVALKKVQIDALQAGRLQGGGAPQPRGEAPPSGGGSVQEQAQAAAPQPASGEV